MSLLDLHAVSHPCLRDIIMVVHSFLRRVRYALGSVCDWEDTAMVRTAVKSEEAVVAARHF